jgi:hypothetical protein
VIPLARRHETVNFDKNLSYSQQLQYVTVTNRKNLWKEAYKKYGKILFLNLKVVNFNNMNSIVINYNPFYFSDGFFCREKSMTSNICLSPHDTIIRDILSRFYNCPIVHSQECSRKISLTENESHSNILPANLVFETNKYFYLLQVILVTFVCNFFVDNNCSCILRRQIMYIRFKIV